MSIFNISEREISAFFLIGIPGLEHVHIWISVPICLMYLVAILGNCTILFMIRTEPSLHAPMYYFLSTLAVSDLGLSRSSLPTMLLIFALNATGISPSACFAQEFFIHGFTNLESSVLLVMAFVRFLAICNPLRYSSILPNARVAKMGLVFFIKSMLLVLPFPFTLKRLTYCRKSLLSHSHCLHQDVMKLACVDNTVHSFYGFFVALCVMTDSVFIAVFYVFICIPGSGRSPGEGNATPPVLLPGESHGQRSLVDYSPWDHKESDTTQQLHFLSLHLCIHPEDHDGNWIL